MQLTTELCSPINNPQLHARVWRCWSIGQLLLRTKHFLLCLSMCTLAGNNSPSRRRSSSLCLAQCPVSTQPSSKCSCCHNRSHFPWAPLERSTRHVLPLPGYTPPSEPPSCSSAGAAASRCHHGAGPSRGQRPAAQPHNKFKCLTTIRITLTLALEP